VTKASRQKYQKMKDLKDILNTNFIIGVTYGASYSDEYEALLKNKDFKKHLAPVSSLISNIRKLMQGRIDGFIEDELTGTATSKKMGLGDQIRILFYLYGIEDAKSYLMYSKKTFTKEQVAKLDQALIDMKKDGTYNKILAKYKLDK
jgi:polar amino acid transport system substrate-binding protein